MSTPTIVLLHGLFGVSRMLGRDYFVGVKRLYEEAGFRVLVPNLPAASRINIQAKVLAKKLTDEQGPIHIIAHSMGGLCARYYITHLSGHAKVRSLTTLSTPHHGSSLADYICQSISIFRLFSGVHDLTTPALKDFNAHTPDMPQVQYRSYSTSRPIHEIPWYIHDLSHIVAQHEGDNDGEVSSASAQWGKHVATLHADHFEVIGQNFWFNPFKKRVKFNHLPVYHHIGQWIKANF